MRWDGCRCRWEMNRAATPDAEHRISTRYRILGVSIQAPRRYPASKLGQRSAPAIRRAGPVRVMRASAVAVTAVGSAAAGHATAGHQAPHPVVVLLALAMSIPVCVNLSGVRLPRVRLAASIALSQALLHGLFALFPAERSSPAEARSPAVGAGAHHAEHAHQPALAAPEALSVGGGIPEPGDATMVAAHAGAGLLTYGVLRRGQVFLEAMVWWLALTPALLLLGGPNRPPVISPSPLPEAEAPRPLHSMWPGVGPRTVRGPPSVVN